MTLPTHQEIDHRRDLLRNAIENGVLDLTKHHEVAKFIDTKWWEEPSLIAEEVNGKNL